MTRTIAQALAAAEERIDPLDARVLLCHALARDMAYLIAHRDEPLDPERLHAFESLAARRSAGEPVAYLTGRREFYGLDFRVTPAVLIPRPETECLVELALEHIPRGKPCTVADLGTGSGCVAIAIARHRSQAWITATDASPEALAVARGNAAALAVTNVEFAAGSWWHAVEDRCFDLVVSNPPYVAEGDPHLGEGDLRFEPRVALAGGPDGLDAIRQIAAGAGAHLEPGGWILIEHGFDQGPSCRALLAQAGLADVRTWRDLAGHERVSGGRRP